MSPGDLSKLAASLATAEGVKPAHVAVVLSLDRVVSAEFARTAVF